MTSACDNRETSSDKIDMPENSVHKEDEYQNENLILSCESCETFSDNSGSLQGHGRTHAYSKETDEAYDVSRTGDGKAVVFTCKLCESSFSSQKSVKQHCSMKHGIKY